MPQREFIKAVGLVKHFGPKAALQGVNFSVHLGEIHALLGENGAGKSTLMNILYGLVQPDLGTLEVNGQPIRILTPRVARLLGIGMVHQHFSLVPDLTVLENIILGAEPTRFGLIDARTARADIERLCKRVGIELDLSAKVKALPVGILQRIEIVKALFRGARLLILDEPTALLTPTEAEHFLRFVRQLRDKGIGSVLVTHKLSEVMQVADRVTVLREGKVVASLPARAVTERQLAEMMMGGEPTVRLHPRHHLGPVRLQVCDLTCGGVDSGVKVSNVTFSVHGGEIVAVVAAAGNGETELLEALALGKGIQSGTILLSGVNITRLPPYQRMRAGLGILPPDRSSQALFTSASVSENFQAVPPARWWEWFLPADRQMEPHTVEKLIRTYRVQGATASTPIWTLSGGNQQKVALARVLETNPTALLIANPTRGVDVASRSLSPKHGGFRVSGIQWVRHEQEDIPAV